MEKLWNDFELKKPPILTIPSTHTKFIADLHGLIETFYSKHNRHEEEFNETAALLGRLMARRKNSFSKMKGFKDICKLNAALCRLLRLDFKRDLDGFRSTLPDVIYEENTVVHLPTRDTYEFLLARLLAVCELHKRIVQCSIEAGEYFGAQLRIQFFFEINTLLLAVIAKIHNLNIKLGNLSIHFYNHLQQYRSQLPLNKKSKFQQISESLPTSLAIIETREALMQKNPAIKTSNSETQQALEQSVEDLILQEEKIKSTPVKAKHLKKTDMGKMVERSSKENKSFDFNKLSTTEDIQKFITKETKSRANNLSSCLTKQVLSHEWAGATKLFERKIQNGEEKKAINIFKKFISSKL
ncbi:uncharacterized protein LOC106090913 [Stomoxys calcitrans]|uniref:uncharacterized protein LOC106090913 n=1 Tax=Stomoxys calcitrans TaxID=35570 RepID=UPI0027E26B80|nr:uncharacterized protein LOC106090913 [Stomoxys calcitrans]